MVVYDSHRQRMGRQCRISVTILGVLALWGSSQLQGPEAGAARPNHREPQRHITVHQGQLSVQLQEAELVEVLAEIGRQAGIAITSSLRSEPRLSAHFTGLLLEGGLRRLLRIASLSFAVVCAPGSEGAAALREVHVFEAVPEALAPLQTSATRGDASGPREASPPSSAALAEISHTWAAPPETVESDMTRRFRARFDMVEPDSIPATEESGLAPGLLIALEGARLSAGPR